MDTLDTLNALGVTIPSAAYLVGSLVFGLIGYVGYRRGKVMERPTQKWIGIGLMIYPYGVSQTWALYAVGAVLCAGLVVYDR